MAYQRERRLQFAPGLASAIQVVGSTATILSPFGTSVINVAGAGAKVFTLALPAGAPPLSAGIQKNIVCNATGVLKVSVTVAGATTAGFLVGAGGNAAGSTFRTIVFSSKSTQRRTAMLVSLDNTRFGLVSMSTGTSLAG